MKFFWLLLFLVILSINSTNSSLINDFFTGARNLWPKPKDISSLNQLKDLPKVQFEIPKESEAFLKQGLDIINAPKEALDLCSHRVIMTLKKNCNQMSTEEIGKLAVMLMNCQLEIEGRSIYPCKPEMNLAQCTMGFDNTIYENYNIVLQRALSVCSALKQQQFRIFTELAVNRLMEVAQKQGIAINEALQNQKRINEMGIQNIQEYRDNFDRIKETQIQNMEFLSSAKEQIFELNSDIHRQLEIQQQAEQKLYNIEKSAEMISQKLESTNDKIVQHYKEAIQFMEHFKSIMQMIAVVTSAIERVFIKISEIMNEIGVTINEDTAISLLLNLIYFMCGMVFILFFNLQRRYKRVLIVLFLFNSTAAFYQSDISLLAINILVWLSFFGYFMAKKLKEKLNLWQFKFLGFTKMSNDSDEEVQSGRKSVSRARSKTPLSNKPVAKKTVVPPSRIDEDAEDSEIADLCEQEMIRIQQNIPLAPTTSNLTATTTNMPLRPETPSNRPMTPAMLRVMKTDGVDVQNRAGTPFTPGIPGRIQCQAFTNKGAQCRNAALIGYAKCKVHNYE